MDQKTGQGTSEKGRWFASHAINRGTVALNAKLKVQEVMVRELEVLTRVKTTVWSATTAIRKDIGLLIVD